jgi:Kdo2-lipid IVA lauroyltransferase/acyltransferase
MRAVSYYIFFAINWITTFLPFSILYLISDLLYFILYYFPSYRRKVVATNLKNSFPEKSVTELRQIEKKFYRHLADLFLETFKLSHLSEKQFRKRFTVSNLGVIERLYEQKRDIVAVMGHYNNWEWLSLFPVYTKYKTISIYKPLQNKHFDTFINRIRSKHGMFLTPMSSVIREIIGNKKAGINTISVFISDQIPVKAEIQYWTNFLNQDTPVYMGIEKVATRYDMAIVYFNIQKIKRGYYNLEIELLFDHTSGLPVHVITDAHVRRLEELINAKPEYWIWSHRRWKHMRPDDYV